jgi:sugar phosphate isomerase/epimerase
LDGFRLPVDEALKKAVEVGAQGIQVYATKGELAPENLVGEKRREFARKVADSGLKISALCGDIGRFDDPAINPGRIERSKRIMDMACDLGVDVVTTHIGVVPTSADHPRYKIMQDACGELCRYADSMKAHFAIETGPETATVLKGFLDGLHSTGVAVNLDPANLVMVTGDDPVQAVYTLRDYIVHTHAKDGVKLRDNIPEVVYGLQTDDVPTGRGFLEVPLGEGSVQWPAYLKALDEIGYHGFLTIEREVGPDPVKDISNAVRFLEEKIRG